MPMQLTNPFAGLEDAVEENVPLARFTWYKIGGPARWFLRPRTVEPGPLSPLTVLHPPYDER